MQYACEAFATPAQFLASECACDLDAGDTDFIEMVLEQASDMLAYLSGGKARGTCTVRVWPFKQGSMCGGHLESYPQTYQYGVDGIPLRGPNTEVVGIMIDGVPLAASEWRLLNEHYLIRLGGESWPTHNDLTAALGAEGTWTIQYRFGPPVDYLARQAAIELACHLAADFTDGASDLPTGARSVNLQGVAVDLESRADALRDGDAGLPMVMRFLAIHAPDGRYGPAVESPELSGGWQLVTRNDP